MLSTNFMPSLSIIAMLTFSDGTRWRIGTVTSPFWLLLPLD